MTTHNIRVWLGEAKLSCILCHRGVQLTLANSCARPAILVAGKGRGGMFLFLLFLHFYSFSFLPCSSLSSLLLSLLSLFSLSLEDDTKWPRRVDMSLKPNTNKNPQHKLLWRNKNKSSQHSHQILILKLKWLRTFFLKYSWLLLSQTSDCGFRSCMFES